MIVDFSEDTKNLLERLISALSPKTEIISEPVKIVKPTIQVKDDQEKETDEKVTLTMIRTLIQEKAESGKTSEIVKALGKYGAKSATLLDEENYSSFYKDLKNI